MKKLFAIATLATSLILGITPTTHANEQTAGFKLTDTQGDAHHLEKYQGQWLLINFWATWCPPCLEEMPELENLHQNNKDKQLQVISIAVDSGSDQTVTDVAAQLNVSFPVINWNYRQNPVLDKQIHDNFGGIQAVPTTLLYTPDGELVAQQRGGKVTQADIEAYIRKNSR